MRDRVQRHGWIGNDPRAIVARDLAVQFGAIGFNAASRRCPALDALGRRTDLAFAAPGQCPALPDCDDRCARRCRVRPGAHWRAPPSVRASARPSRCGSSPAPSGQNRSRPPTRMVSMTWACGLGMPSSAMSQCTLRSATMPRSTNSACTKSRASSMPCAWLSLARKRELDLAGKLRVLADLERLDIVPKPFAVAPRLRRILRQHHLGMDDAALGGKVMAAVEALVAQPRSRAVGGGRHRAGARLAANDLDVKMIDRHRDQIIGTAKRTSERRISAPSLEKFSGGTSPSQTVPATLQHYAAGAQLSSPHQHCWRTRCANHGISTGN